MLINSKVQLLQFKVFRNLVKGVFIRPDTHAFGNGDCNNIEIPLWVYYGVIDRILDSKRYFKTAYISLLR